jgi:ASC-1-like (ASCH) protein
MVNTMLLTFSKDSYVEDIKSGVKIHTIRLDKPNRWKPGMKIHFWRGNPRNVNAKRKSYAFDEGVCKSVQTIEIIYPTEYFNDTIIKVDGRKLTTDEMKLLAWNDGFANLIEFQMHFNYDFKGKIIHWTDFKY